MSLYDQDKTLQYLRVINHSDTIKQIIEIQRQERDLDLDTSKIDAFVYETLAGRVESLSIQVGIIF